MMFYSRKIWHLLLLPLLTVFVGGCDSYADMGQWDISEEPWDGHLYLKLNIRVNEGGRNGATRAESANTYFENPELDTEQLQTLRVIMVNDANNTIAYNRILTTEPRFKVDFSTKYRIYLIGNEAGLETILPYGSFPGEDEVYSPIDFFNHYYREGSSYPNENAVQLENIIISAPLFSIGGGGMQSGLIKPLIDNVPDEFALFPKEILPIPMTEKFEVTTVSRPANGPEDNVLTQDADFFLTRAASKFTFVFKKGKGYSNEITDKIEFTDKIPVKFVRISGLTPKEYLFPTNTEYLVVEGTSDALGGREITDFEVPELQNNPGDYNFRLPADVKWGEEYSPEIYFSEGVGYTDNASEMRAAPGEEEEEEPEVGFYCTISCDDDNIYKPIKLKNLPYGIPRNTHVKITITINAESIEAKVEVEEWTEKKLFIDYKDNITIQDKLSWTQGSYSSISEDSGDVYLRPWSTEKTRHPLEGRFRFATPRGATWTAYLLQTEGQDFGAFGFLKKDENGNFIKDENDNPLVFDHVSGTINETGTNGDENAFSTIYIVSRFNSPSGDEANKARLQIVVNVGAGTSGTVTEADLTPDGKTYKNFTIIQNVE